MLVLLHVILAPLLLPIRVRSMEGVGRTIAMFDRAVPATEDVRSQIVVVVNAPNDGLVSYLPFVRASTQRPFPRALRLLSTSFDPVTVTRTGPRSISVRPDTGFLATMAERMLRAKGRPFNVGDEVDLGDTRVVVNEVRTDGRVAEIEVAFEHALDDPRMVWVCFRGGEFQRFVPPEIGEQVVLPAVSRRALLGVLLGEEPATGR